MVNALLGRKIGMTQVYDDAGDVRPCTVIEAGPCVVTQLKTVETDGYAAAQIGFGQAKLKRVTEPLKGHYAKAGVPPAKVLREVAVLPGAALHMGQTLTVSVFEDVKLVDVVGTSKGRGFAGVIKRHNFAGGPASHGSKRHRTPGSISGGCRPARVIKGRRMAGHLGAAPSTVRNLSVVRIDADRNLILVEGSVPGHTNAYVLVRRAKAPPPPPKQDLAVGKKKGKK